MRLKHLFVALISSLSTVLWATPLLVPPPPPVDAQAYVLMDYHSGRALSERNAHTRMEPASLTKMMTMYVVDYELAQGRLRAEEAVHISDKAWRAQGSRMFLEVNQKVPVHTLVRGIIIQSGNDASIALAEHIAGSEDAFVDLMNQHAQHLGMTNTHFRNATGLPDPQHHSTAHDMALLAQALIKNYPESYALYSQKWFSYNGIKQPNRNRLLWRNEWVDGIKTGSTDDAGYCLVASAKRDDMRLITVVLGAPSDESRTEESQKLISYGFRFYETHKLFAHDTSVRDTRVWMGAQKQVAVGPTQDVFVTIPQGSYAQLDAKVQMHPSLKAPIHAQKSLGTLVISLNNEPLAQVPLVALNEVPPAGLWGKFTDYVTMNVSQWTGRTV